MARHSVNRGFHGFQHVSFLHPAPQTSIGCNQSSITMRLCAGQASAEFALLTRRSLHRLGKGSLYLCESRLLGLHDMMMRDQRMGKWSLLHSELGRLLQNPEVTH